MKSEIAYKFSKDNVIKINAWKKKFPNEHATSSIIYVLHICQKEKGFITEEHMKATAEILGIDFIDVYEIATFYSMFETENVGKNVISICTNISCMLRGSDDLVSYAEKKLGIKIGDSSDNIFLKDERECLAACCGAPMMQVNHKYYENVTIELLDEIIGTLKDEK